MFIRCTFSQDRHSRPLDRHTAHVDNRPRDTRRTSLRRSPMGFCLSPYPRCIRKIQFTHRKGLVHLSNSRFGDSAEQDASKQTTAANTLPQRRGRSFAKTNAKAGQNRKKTHLPVLSGCSVKPGLRSGFYSKYDVSIRSRKPVEY
ncbi:hypothetical protein GRAN_3184 [Granulicella sibirica]|uniref:Uncharacterized protein n=1 Tax=Granulicella sibirica TaxID=2479048 RepID=A0A4Q0SZK0_9BACT|nr:hypothetical protein GRAN_3184 [Granulicella sibirica]